MSLRSCAPFAFVLVLVACGDDDSKGSADATQSTGNDGAILETTSGDALVVNDTNTGPCNPVANTGCAANQTCTYVANETAPSCVTAGVVELGQACSSEAHCKKGVCLNLNDTRSLCYAICETDPDCGSGGSCLTLSNAAFEICKIEGIYENCDLVLQDCVDAAKGCYAVSTEDQPICRVAGTVAAGAACDSAVACVKGAACVNDVCRPVCDLTKTPSDCAAGNVCNAYFDGAGYCEPE